MKPAAKPEKKKLGPALRGYRRPLLFFQTPPAKSIRFSFAKAGDAFPSRTRLMSAPDGLKAFHFSSAAIFFSYSAVGSMPTLRSRTSPVRSMRKVVGIASIWPNADVTASSFMTI